NEASRIGRAFHYRNDWGAAVAADRAATQRQHAKLERQTEQRELVAQPAEAKAKAEAEQWQSRGSDRKPLKIVVAGRTCRGVVNLYWCAADRLLTRRRLRTGTCARSCWNRLLLELRPSLVDVGGPGSGAQPLSRRFSLRATR